MKFIIDNYTWTIEEVEPNSNLLQRSDNIYTLGATDNNTKEIYINRSLSLELKEKVLSHEIVHAICFSKGISLELEVEEIVADFVATYGRQVFEIVDELLYISKNKFFSKI